MVDHNYQPSATAADKKEAKLGLEREFSALLAAMEGTVEGRRVVDQAKGLKNVIYNIYKEACQSSRFEETTVVFRGIYNSSVSYYVQPIFCSLPWVSNSEKCCLQVQLGGIAG